MNLILQKQDQYYKENKIDYFDTYSIQIIKIDNFKNFKI